MPMNLYNFVSAYDNFDYDLTQRSNKLIEND